MDVQQQEDLGAVISECVDTGMSGRTKPSAPAFLCQEEDAGPRRPGLIGEDESVFNFTPDLHASEELFQCSLLDNLHGK
ncbi:hypothetical protein JZ751_005190 [Albula glossodonta]|uniref:Uncharacterized protein n=1 Tax=Albula glossodonta TaxID=121402 RepID=A0A8T2P5Q7_9TELE|nr:hypothetical protein JZ751_005190 [Albula glossodonta]